MSLKSRAISYSDMAFERSSKSTNVRARIGRYPESVPSLATEVLGRLSEYDIRGLGRVDIIQFT